MPVLSLEYHKICGMDMIALGVKTSNPEVILSPVALQQRCGPMAARTLLSLLLLLGVYDGASAQQAAYTLQPGDSIEISVLQDPNLNRKLLIAPDGMISFPLAGQIRAGGLTVKALETQLATRLSKNYLTPPQVTITLADVGRGGPVGGTVSSRIYVTGEVNSPGPYSINQGMTIMQALALSGGLSKFASKSRIQIHRRVAGKEDVFIFNYSDFLSGKNMENNIILKPGDLIIVPERGLFN
jgi:polysaccharide biosynthesis/export protein